MIKKLFKLVLASLMLASWNQGYAQAGKTFSNEKASVVWAFNSADYKDAVTVTPAGAFSLTAFDQSDFSYEGIGNASAADTDIPTVKFVKLKKGSNSDLKWVVKPAKGLTFTPTHVSFYVLRQGTDAKDCLQAELTVGDKKVDLGTYTAIRDNKDTAYDQAKWPGDAYPTNRTNKVDVTLTAEQQALLTSADELTLKCVVSLGSGRQMFFSDIHIDGIVNGTAEQANKYVISATAAPADAAEISFYPEAAEYEEDSQVRISAAKNFGYKFINWTNEAGDVVSLDPTFNIIVKKAEKYTANFKKLNTYELRTSVEGGAADYMVQAAPAPTVVDGKNMYEEGTEVKLTASSNHIITFGSWSNGGTENEITVVMDDDKEFTASFSTIDYIVGWDFYKNGNGGIAAAFASADNDDVSLVLRNANGENYTWLDKSTLAAGGYEGKEGAAVNWTTTGIGNTYWQTKVNASAYTDIKVYTEMAFNYNAYSKQDIQYSTDGENWTTAGSISIPASKTWVDGEFTLPASVNNAPMLYIRWIADKDSEIKGTSSNNDGTAIANIFITGTMQLVNDGKAPVLVSSVPANNADNASANGRIVLTFDEKVKVKDGTTATLADQQLTPAVSGKSVMFEYRGLTYSTPYTFKLPANTISDLTDNAIASEIVINFTTKNRPGITKQEFDFIVPDNGSFVDAITMASKREDKAKRFRIFVKNGNYVIPANKEATVVGTDGEKYPSATTYITTPNVSIIGESRDGVVITNTVPTNLVQTQYGPQNPLEGIGKGDVLSLNKDAVNTYFQDITFKSAMGDSRGRDIVLNDGSNKTICKNVCLWGYQDTYVSNSDNGRYYFEGGILRGRTDFLCGKGDVYYNNVTLQMCEKGGYLAVPSKPKKYGYIFKDCEITPEVDGIDGNFTLGRPWGSGTPIALYIDTKMTARPSSVGWNEMGDGWPARFAEYNSTTASGTVIDLSNRKKVFAKTHDNDPILTAEEAKTYTIGKVMGDEDGWDPTEATEQASAPTNAELADGVITWDNSDYVLCWAVCKNGKVIAFTTKPTYTVEGDTDGYTIRAANEMGGLSEAVAVKGSSGITSVSADTEIVNTTYYNMQGSMVDASYKGVIIKVDTMSDGSRTSTKMINR